MITIIQQSPQEIVGHDPVTGDVIRAVRENGKATIYHNDIQSNPCRISSEGEGTFFVLVDAQGRPQVSSLEEVTFILWASYQLTAVAAS